MENKQFVDERVHIIGRLNEARGVLHAMHQYLYISCEDRTVIDSMCSDMEYALDEAEDTANGSYGSWLPIGPLMGITKDGLQITNLIEQILGMLSVISGVIRSESEKRDNMDLENYRENVFNGLYDKLETIQKIAIKPFLKFKG